MRARALACQSSNGPQKPLKLFEVARWTKFYPKEEHCRMRGFLWYLNCHQRGAGYAIQRFTGSKSFMGQGGLNELQIIFLESGVSLLSTFLVGFVQSIWKRWWLPDQTHSKTLTRYYVNCKYITEPMERLKHQTESIFIVSIGTYRISIMVSFFSTKVKVT